MVDKQKKRRMTLKQKRELMDLLIDFDKQQQKIIQSYERLERRENKLEKRRNEIAAQLADGLKINSISNPIVYKGRAFNFKDCGWGANREYSVTIKQVKKL